METYKRKGNCLLLTVVVFCLSFCPVSVFADYPSADLNGDYRVDFSDFAMMVSQWLQDETNKPDITWVYVDDPGVIGHEGFSGYMSKYETTYAQFCKYLNDALATGDIYVNNNSVYGSNGSNSGVDFVDKQYFKTNVVSEYSQISYSDGVFSVCEKQGHDMSNYCALAVTWYGATAFASYYGWRLPTEWEWQAVADYDGTYYFGCGETIDANKANYNNNNPIGFSSVPYIAPVDYYNSYGYGTCGMAGNALEWTSSCSDTHPEDRVARGGSWAHTPSYCSVSYQFIMGPYNFQGFRVCSCESQEDLNGDNIIDLADFAIMADQWHPDMSPDITWVDINDPGVSGHEGFNGQISKYETTNAQYCQFLNQALATGDIYVDGNDVYGTNGSNIGEDFTGELYYDLAGGGFNYPGVTNGGAARINYTAGLFTVDAGFKNHPVTYVSWYGATAFCNYYGWHLPTEWQWQAVADYDGSFTYGCGLTVNTSIANYKDSNHPHGTTAVGGFGTYGYGMCDMTGNVAEWTITISGNGRIRRDGNWTSMSSICKVSSRNLNYTYYMNYDVGFRVCYNAIIVPDVVGMTQSGAEAAIIGAGLIIGTVSQTYSAIVAAGNIISQNPSGGENAPSESAVNLVISSGPYPVPDITWVSINDSGAGMKDSNGNTISQGGFIGQMSKYETTNAQYCLFLNDALTTGDITVGTDNFVYGANGSNSGEDFVGQVYYNLAGSGYTYDGASNGAAARINYTGTSFTVDSGFENHPVTHISWYGATAFANYYGWRLPTEWQWQAVADYDGSYNYGCGTTIDNSKANYRGSNHPYGTTTVGVFGAYGYGICDMTGNAFEWTSSTYSGNDRVIRGGTWNMLNTFCSVSYRYHYSTTYITLYSGFRVCR